MDHCTGRYQKNMKRFYVVHPTVWLKSALAYFCMFAAKNSFWEKVQFVDQLADLYVRVSVRCPGRSCCNAFRVRRSRA